MDRSRRGELKPGPNRGGGRAAARLLSPLEAFDYRAPMSLERAGRWTLQCDGGARGNPGPGALGYALFDPAGAEVEARGEYIGTVTNNVAEYHALNAGLDAAIRRGVERLLVSMDSELVVRQMTGHYRVKHPGLKPLHQRAKDLEGRIAEVKYRAVPRAENARADRLVNDTLDEVLGTESPR